HRVVVGAVEAARAPVDRLQQVGAPDRLADLDGLGRVDRPLQRAALQDAELDADAVLGALLSLGRPGIHEVQVADHDADSLETEGIQHGATMSAVRVWANPEEVDRGGPHDRPAVLVDRLDQGLQDAAVRLAQRPAGLHGGDPDTERVPWADRFGPAHLVQTGAAQARLARQ